MKKITLLAVFLVAGCSASDPEPEPFPGEAEPGVVAPGGDRAAGIRAQIEVKRNELRQVDIDLGKVAAERFQLDPQPPSEAKTNRMTELARVESECKAKKQALEAEIVQLENQARASEAAPAVSADDALDMALAADTQRRAESEAAAQKRRLEEAERARAAEAAAREREKVQAGPAAVPAAAPGGEGLIFEERWADVILKVRVELQRYKRW